MQEETGFALGLQRSLNATFSKRFTTITISHGKNAMVMTNIGLSVKGLHLIGVAYLVSWVARWETTASSCRELNPKRIKLLCILPFTELGEYLVAAWPKEKGIER